MRKAIIKDKTKKNIIVPTVRTATVEEVNIKTRDK